MIGECILAEECPGMHVTAYTLPKRLLMIALNRKEKQAPVIKVDLEPWLLSASGNYKVREYDIHGRPERKETTAAHWQVTTRTLDQGDMVIYEFEIE